MFTHVALNFGESAVFETISSDAEFRRVRALAYVDLNRNINGKLGSDWKPRAGDAAANRVERAADSLMIISA